MGLQEFEACHKFYHYAVDMDGLPTEVHNSGLLGIEQQVVDVTSYSHAMHLQLIIVFDEASHCGAVCKLNNDIRTTYRSEVILFKIITTLIIHSKPKLFLTSVCMCLCV